MKIFDCDAFRQCFNIRSQDRDSFLPESVGFSADSYYIHYWSAELQLSIMQQLSVQGYGPDQHFVVTKQSASRLCSSLETISC